MKLFFCLLLGIIAVSADDIVEDDRATSYNPDRQIVYHLYTRSSPTKSEPILNGNVGLLKLNSYDPSRKTVFLVPDGDEEESSNFVETVLPAYLQAADVNVIVVDWSRGVGNLITTTTSNAVTTARSVASFIRWLNEETGATGDLYHLVGHGHGAHLVGIVGRNLNSDIGYITALSPKNLGWVLNNDRFRNNDGWYTEVIHTSAGMTGYLGSLGHADFYPNGGVDMPGCNLFSNCDHDRSFRYFAESLVSGGFNSNRCLTFINAMTGSCGLLGTARMGGVTPKTGVLGSFHLNTNSQSPFSRR